LASFLSLTGHENEAVGLFQQAFRLSPRPPLWLPIWYGHALHLLGKNEKAAEQLKNAIARNPKAAYVHARLAAVYVDLGQMDDAKVAIDKTLELNGMFTAKNLIRRFKSTVPEKNAWLKDLVVKAGLPN